MYLFLRRCVRGLYRIIFLLKKSLIVRIRRRLDHGTTKTKVLFFLPFARNNRKPFCLAATRAPSRHLHEIRAREYI